MCVPLLLLALFFPLTFGYTQLAQDLMILAEQQKAAVVLMNQVTTKFDHHGSSSGGGGGGHMVAALGDSWAHVCATRIQLFWRGTERCARILKSSSRPDVTIVYDVTNRGVRKPSTKRKSDGGGDHNTSLTLAPSDAAPSPAGMGTGAVAASSTTPNAAATAAAAPMRAAPSESASASGAKRPMYQAPQ